MKFSLSILMFLITSFNYSQIILSDSIKSILENDSNISSIEYEKLYYKNGIFGAEGWIFYSYYYPHHNGKKFNQLIKHRIGNWKFYRKNGSLKMEEYKPFNDSLTVTRKYYNKKGELKRESFIVPIENPKANSSLSKDGKYSGITILNKSSSILYKNGKIERSYSQVGIRNIGDYIIYYQNGQMESKKSYNLDFKLDGSYKTWTKEGQLLIEGEYKNGKKVGIWRWYDKTGKLKKEKNFL